ncbi:MAG: chemotaxis response regulator protein-glutamate methylesterase [Gemmataceae bacterium]
MEKTRVMVVDDSVVIRRMVAEVVAAEPDMVVSATASNGRLALARLQQVPADIVILDVEMPDMDGLETLRELRKEYPRLPVLMFSTLTRRGALVTLDALALGASDYVPKPDKAHSLEESLRYLREQVLPRIRALCQRHTVTTSPLVGARRSGRRLVEVVAVGVSTGGPNALADILPQLPREFPVPVVIVQHMPPVFTKLLAERLDARCQLRCHEAGAGQTIEPGSVYIAPGDWHLEVRRAGAGVMAHLHQEPPENSCRPAVDVLFRSAARVYGAGVLAVVLTGMGQDGLRGCEKIRAAGGQIIVQDAASSVVWGMPGVVAQAGLADALVPLAHMAQEIIHRVQSGRSAGHWASCVTTSACR